MVRKNAIIGYTLVAVALTSVGYLLRIAQERHQLGREDKTWIGAARSCWLGLAKHTDDEIGRLISDPRKLRTVFPKYGTLGDIEISDLSRKPIAITFVNYPQCTSGIDLSSGFVIDRPSTVKSMYLAATTDSCKADELFRKDSGHKTYLDPITGEPLGHPPNQWFCDVSDADPLQ